jgi:dTMP kinase
MLYVAREVQLAVEVLRPALERADVVIADRYFYTAQVLAGAGRDMPAEEVRPIVESAAAGVWPEMAFLIDVDPSVARGRRKVSKMLNPADRRPVSRKGLTGSGLQVRLRAGYKQLAESDPARWVIVDNTDADLDQVVTALTELILQARAGGKVPGGRLQVGAAPPSVTAPIDSVAAAYQAFLAWVDRRAFREPTLAAYVLAGISGAEIDARRLSLAGAAPKVIARGLRGLSDPVSWRLRRLLIDAAPMEVALSLEATIPSTNDAWTLRELLADAAPAAVALSLEGLDDETAWALRAQLYDRAPDAVLASLALLDSPRAWEVRARWISERGGLDRACDTYDRARALAKAVTGLDGAQAWEMRKATRESAPVAALASLKGVTSDRAWSWREKAIGRAPKAVLSTIAGMDDARAWALRVANAPRVREALDSMIALDHPTAWDLRETCLDIWPANTIKSLGVLVNGQRGHELLLRALAAHPDQISLLKQAANIATGASLTPAVMAA